MAMSGNGIFGSAGAQFDSAAGLAQDDERLGLRYHLLRLTVAGLSQQDVQDLGDLARLAFENAPVTDATTKIKQRADASPLASAIADILDHASRGPTDPQSVMMGAVLGAYASLPTDSQGTVHSDVAIFGAIGGAVALSTSPLIVEVIRAQVVPQYLRMQDGT